jgi:hypothetical protein
MRSRFGLRPPARQVFIHYEINHSPSRLALLHRYKTLALEHAQRVSDLSELAHQSLANESLRDQLEKALLEVESSSTTPLVTAVSNFPA